MIVSEVGNHPAVRALVYVAAFRPEVGETAGGLQSQMPPAAAKSVVPAGGVNPDLERFMAKRAESQAIELPGSHAIFLSHPKKVAALIEKAAKAAAGGT